MRLIGSIARREHAERFVAYLKTEGIDAQIEREASEFELWIKDEDRVKDSMGMLEKFRENPDEAKYLRAKGLALELLKKEEQRRQQVQKNIVRVSQSRSMEKKPPLTLMLIVISGFVALFTSFGDYDDGSVFRALAFSAVDNPQSIELLEAYDGDRDALGIRLASIQQGQVWRLLTPIFIHHGPIHILFNMFMLFQMGKIIENRCGTMFFGILVFASAVIPNFFQGVVPYNVGGSVPGLVEDSLNLLNGFGGMSGVVYGLFGFMWMKTLFQPSAGMNLPQSTIIILVGWLFFCMTPMSKEVGLNVANWAHAVGLVVGIVAGMLPMMVSGNKPRKH